MGVDLKKLHLHDHLLPLKFVNITEQRLSQPKQVEKLKQVLRYDRPDHELPDLEIDEVISSCGKVIYKAVAIAQTGVNIRKADLLSQLREVEANPSRVFRKPRLQEEILGAIALHYQRENEPPGTWWMDVTEGFGHLHKIEIAARQAADEIEQAKSVRRQDLSFAYLTLGLKRIYERFGLRVFQSVPRDTVHHPEEGPFGQLVELVCEDWFFWLRRKTPAAAKTVASATRKATDKKWVKSYSDHFAEFRPRRR